jgi:F420 biosynthesis protein FbiB-like protein
MGEEFRNDLLADGNPPDLSQVQVRRSIDRIQAAPVVVVLCTDFACADGYPDPDRRTADSIMLVQDAALGGLQFMLAAHAEGLGAVWMCAPLFAPETVRGVLVLPESWEPQALILVGYPSEERVARERKPLANFAKFL